MREFTLKKIASIIECTNSTPEHLMDWHLGCDEKLYALFQDRSGYTVSIIEMDWAKSEVKKQAAIALEETKGFFSDVRPLGEDILVFGARSVFDSKLGKGEENAFVFDRSGKFKYAMCLGDGITGLLTYPGGRIVTGYFDEGIFGNFGWSAKNGAEPLGSAGIVTWDANGNKIWENSEQRIWDVYDLEYGDDGCFWYYAYRDFNLIKVDKDYRAVVYSMDVDGCDCVIYDSKLGKVIFDGGYTDSSNYYVADIIDNAVSNKEKVAFRFGGHVLTDYMIQNSVCGVVIFDSEGNVYNYE